MKIEFVHHHHIHADPCVISLLERIMAAIDNLETEVAENTDAVQSAITLLTNLKIALDEAIASGSMAKVQELSDRLSTNTDSLAAAVAANTPADPTP